MFPYDPVDLYSELFVNSGWRDITPDVRAKPITITRGRPNEAAQVPPSKCGFVVNNQLGTYSPRNPTGEYYGSIGRNTPIRKGIRRERDEFARTVSNGWGTSTTGQSWSIAGTNWATSDFAVNGTAATQSVTAANNHRLSYLASTTYRDVEVAVTCTVQGITDVTGGSLEPANIVLRGLSITDYYMVRVVITSAEAVTISLHHYNGTIYAAATQVLTGWAGEALRVRALIEGHTMHAKVWRASGAEPYAWQVSATINVAVAPYAGFVGIRSGVAAGNTNTPVVFAYDDLDVRLPRFAGEVSNWPPKWDRSGHDKYVPVQASGEMRRLGQGVSPLKSALRRAYEAETSNPIRAYWPCEDGKNAASLASAFAGHPPIRYAVVKPPSLAAYTGFDCSAPLPIQKGTSYFGTMPPYTHTGKFQFRFLMCLEDGLGFGGVFLCNVETNNAAAATFSIVYADTSGSLTMQVSDSVGNVVYTNGPHAQNVNGRKLLVSLELEQDGANIDWTITTLGVNEPSAGVSAGTILSQTLGTVTGFSFNSTLDSSITAVYGHITAQTAISSIFDHQRALDAWARETSGNRIKRLCTENNVGFSHTGDLDRTTTMGPQRVATLLDLVRECAAVDFGTLHEPRGVLGLAYRTRESLYNQAATVAAAYGDLSPPFEPVDDDQLTRNDVTVTRRDGSSYRAIETSGPLSVLSPAQGGVGRYDVGITLNCEKDDQVRDLAEWLRHQGTVDEPRYPAILIKLAARAFAASEALMRAALTLSVDDRLTISGPPAGQAPDLITQLARGFSERIQPWEHDITVNCSPESPFQVIQLDDGVSRLASDTTTLAEDLDTTETGVDIAISSGPLWTTSAGDMPIPTMIGGEALTVSAISGASSPQTMTAARSANTVVKTHATGTPVRLAWEPILGL